MNLRSRRIGFVAGWFALLVAAPATGADLAVGLTAYQLRDYAAAERVFATLAADGEAVAQAFLGEMYLRGQGVGRDEAEAARLFRLAAEQGHPGAQFRLARLYWHGRGVEQDNARAVSWMRRAAAAGNLDAQFAVAGIYDYGPPDLRDAQEAERWYRKAAAQGHPQAQDLFRHRERRELARLLAERNPTGSTAPTPGGRYQVQLGAYRTLENARRGWSIVMQRFSAELEDANLQVVHVDLGSPGGQWFRLRAGSMASHDQAKTLCSRLLARRADIPCLVIESRPPESGAKVAVVYPPR